MGLIGKKDVVGLINLSIASLFKMGTSLKGKNQLLEGVNSFLYEQFLIV